jgi:2'-5' RNA ligase
MGNEALPEKLRAFVALRMAPAVEDELAAFIEKLRLDASGVRWVPRSNLHVTLRFLGGAVESAKIAALMPRLQNIAHRTQPFVLGVVGTGAFPNLARPRVVWVGLRAQELALLAEQIERAAVECGLARETRPYSPHLTIGRVRDLTGWKSVRGALAEAAAHDFGSCPITGIILYRSILGPTTSRYQELARFDFG